MKLGVLLMAAVSAALVVPLSCAPAEEEEEDPCPPQCPHDYSTFVPGEPVSFKTEVLPLLRQRCASSLCHSPDDCSFDSCINASKAHLYLGPKPKDATTVVDLNLRQFVAAQMVGKDSRTIPSIKLVVPSEPAQSFLMLKVDGCHQDTGLACVKDEDAKTPCGVRMPNGREALCDDQSDVLRRWIAQGAVVD